MRPLKSVSFHSWAAALFNPSSRIGIGDSCRTNHCACESGGNTIASGACMGRPPSGLLLPRSFTRLVRKRLQQGVSGSPRVVSRVAAHVAAADQNRAAILRRPDDDQSGIQGRRSAHRCTVYKIYSDTGRKPVWLFIAEATRTHACIGISVGSWTQGENDHAPSVTLDVGTGSNSGLPVGRMRNRSRSQVPHGTGVQASSTSTPSVAADRIRWHCPPGSWPQEEPR